MKKTFLLMALAAVSTATLAKLPAPVLDALLHPMWDISFPPLITLEVFSLDDFLNSHQTMLESYQRHVSKH